jgi:ubiquinone/menaquinone biosynthesis C-methylase UbiE
MMEEKEKKSKEYSAPVLGGDQFLNPRQIIAQLEILPGMEVAHFGCGTGYFTVPIAERIGETGKIWALDILEHKLDLLRAQVKNLGLKNVFLKRVNLEGQDGSTLEDGSVDWVIMVNMLHQNDKRNRIVSEAGRVLKEKGQILFIDWKSGENSVGPEMKVRVAREDMIKIVRKNGLGIANEFEAGKFCFGMILTK